ncbi:hypothetical protein CsSME_00001230 [Camellia sinensis var. sinensis]
MSKSSSSFIIRYLHHHHHRHIPSKPSPPTYPNSSNGISQLLSHHHPNLTPWRTHFSSSSIPRIFQNPPNQLTPQPNLLLNRSFLGFRYFSFKNSELGTKINGNFAKNAVKNPTSAVRDAFSRYQEAVGLQIEAFWKRNSLVLWGAGGLMVCILLWKALFGVANMFIGLSEGMAKYGFLALSSAIVAFTYDMKLLAVDIPMATGPDQRIYIIGDEAEYRVGGGLISELRDPVVKAMAAVKEFEDHDKREDEEDAKRELQEAERRHKEEIEKLEKGS